ncbi:hypothetical protein FW784_14105 [Lysobacter lacus]|uniref:Transmembrane protein n=1 Tax=Cognatilysobacter lacus TaxID=1643323 RepID=A0A5D8YEM1_9GAMM|nr:hypothetical protein FW784_14105 [Lysobacter lacus]
MTQLRNFADRFSWPLYCRSYLVTLGLLFAGGAVWAVAREPKGFAGLPVGWQLGAAVAVVTGFCLFVAGLAGSRRVIERWADSWSKHDIAVIVMLLALPVYLVLALVLPRK